MISYTVAHNPDERILKKAVECLDRGELVVFPTDTNWQLVCNPFKTSAVEKLYRLKSENIHKHFSFLCPSISKASQIADIDSLAYKQLKKLIPGNFTFIFNAKKKVQKAIKASKTDHEVGIRFSPAVFTNNFLNYYDDFLLSTNLTNEMLSLDDGDDIYGILIEENLGHLISMIIDPGIDYEFEISTIVSYLEGIPKVIREGAGIF